MNPKRKPKPRRRSRPAKPSTLNSPPPAAPKSDEGGSPSPSTPSSPDTRHPSLSLSRNVSERMQKIHHLIAAGKYPSAIQLARQFEVNKKTILRDLEWMKSHEKAPIAYHRARHGYGLNGWLMGPSPVSTTGYFVREAQIVQPARTPVLADCVLMAAWPAAADPPATDLFTGDLPSLGMQSMCIPRHGSRAGAVYLNWPPSSPLPGAVNVVFVDGHAEGVKLDRLWQCYWSPDYVPPANRPGLP